MARYPSYQPTNIPWLPEIPVGWEMRRLRYCFSRVFSGLWGMEPTSNDDGIVCYRVADFDYAHGGISEDKLTYRAYRSDEIVGRLVEEGDLLLEKSGGGDNSPVGRVVIVDKKIKATCSNFIQALHCKEDYSSKFLCYVFRYMYSKKINGFYYNQTIGIQNLKVAEYLSIKTPLPPLPEQEQIVAYLDKQTAKVDALIKAKTEQMALLKELRERTIADAVTRGLPSEHTSFQSTNIPWLLEIPDGWEMKKVRQHFRLRSQKVSEKDYPALSVAKVGVVPQLDDVAISLAEGDSRKLVRRGDFVVNSRSDRKGSCGIAPRDGSVTTISIVLEPHAITHSYVHYLFRSIPWVEEFYRNGRGIVADLWTTRYQEMRNMLFPYPPLSEQERIVAYLDKQAAKIDKAVALLASGIEHLKAYRERLIADVVTGQLKVE